MDINLKILSPETLLLERKVDKVELPGLCGRFMVLRNHGKLISALDKGQIVWFAGSESDSIPIKGGFAEVNDNVVTVCVE